MVGQFRRRRGDRGAALGSDEKTSSRMGGEMMLAVKEFLRECLRLLYWVFFKPTALRAHINQIAPGYEERLLKAERGMLRGATVNLRELRENPKLRIFVLKALFVILCAPAVLYLSIGLAITTFGGDFNWQNSWDALAFGVALGVAPGVAFGVVVSVAVGVAFGVALGVAGGVAFSVADGIARGVAVGFAGGVARRLAVGGARGVARGVVLRVALGLTLRAPRRSTLAAALLR